MSPTSKKPTAKTDKSVGAEVPAPEQQLAAAEGVAADTATDDAAPPTATDDATPPTATDDATPPTATDDAAPPTATDDAAPPTATDDAAPPTATDDAAPPTATDDAAPPTATDDAAPPTAKAKTPAVTLGARGKTEPMIEMPIGSKSVWIIGHAKTDQRDLDNAARIANWLRLSYKLIDINPPSFLTSLLRLRSLPSKYSTELTEPWPEVVITAGPNAAGVIPTLKKAGINSFCVHIGAPKYSWKNYDATLIPDHFLTSKSVLQHPSVIPYRIGFSSLSMEEYIRAENNREARKLRLDLPLPRLFAIIGAGNQSYTLNTKTARRIGKRLVEAVKQQSGSLMVMALPGTSPDVVLALRNEVRGEHSLFWGSPEDGPNPYNTFLGAASQIAVTWESPQRLVDACNTKKAVFLLPLPPRRNWRGMRQDKLMNSVHGQLLNGRHARIFSGTLKGFVPTPLNEIDRVGKLVKEQWRKYMAQKQIAAQPRPLQAMPVPIKPLKTPENAES